MVRQQHGLPTYEERVNGAEFNSDHVPLLIRGTLPAFKNYESAPVNMITYNTLGAGCEASGFHKRGDAETDDEAKVRYTRIAEGLVKSVQNNQVDIIALQETKPIKFIANELKKKLKKQLGQNWEVVVDAQKSMGMVTLYNKGRFKETGKRPDPDEKNRIRTLILVDKKREQPFAAHNVWGLFNAFPHELENIFRKLLTRFKTSFLLSDSNSRGAPVHNRPLNLTKGIVPLIFGKLNENSLRKIKPTETTQIPDYPDVAFRGNAGDIEQLEMEVLDLATGEVVETPSIKEQLLEEGSFWDEQRMILCLDDYYQTEKLIDKKSIFEYEAWLAEQLADKDVLVRVAANCNNEKAIGIRFKPRSELCNYLYAELNSDDALGFQFKFVASTSVADEMREFPCVFAPLDRVALLHQLITEWMTAKAENRDPLHRSALPALDSEELEINEVGANNNNNYDYVEPNDQDKSSQQGKQQGQEAAQAFPELLKKIDEKLEKRINKLSPSFFSIGKDVIKEFKKTRLEELREQIKAVKTEENVLKVITKWEKKRSVDYIGTGDPGRDHWCTQELRVGSERFYYLDNKQLMAKHRLFGTAPTRSQDTITEIKELVPSFKK